MLMPVPGPGGMAVAVAVAGGMVLALGSGGAVVCDPLPAAAPAWARGVGTDVYVYVVGVAEAVGVAACAGENCAVGKLSTGMEGPPLVFLVRAECDVIYKAELSDMERPRFLMLVVKRGLVGLDGEVAVPAIHGGDRGVFGFGDAGVGVACEIGWVPVLCEGTLCEAPVLLGTLLLS